MKKFIVLLMAVLLCLGLPMAAAAAELTSCTVSAQSVVAAPGATVTMEIRIDDNPGFTNFAIALGYDSNNLTLVSLEASENLTGINVNWKDADDNEKGFVVCASAEPVKKDGVLLTATFQIAEGFTGETEVVPEVHYIRNNAAIFSIFESVHATVHPGMIRSNPAGDLTGDGIIEYNDVMLAYKAYLGETELTQHQMDAVDRNRNGTIEASEYQAIYQIYIGG